MHFYELFLTIRAILIYFLTDAIVPPSRGGRTPEPWRASKVIILCVVALIWISLLGMFFKQWGIIRMFLPYAARAGLSRASNKSKRKRRFGGMKWREKQTVEKVIPPVVILETDVAGGTRAVMDTSV